MPNRVLQLKALSDEIRLRVLNLLASGPRCVNQMVDVLDVKQNLLSHHLRVLRQAAMVEYERQGNRIVYRLARQIKLREEEFDFGCCRLRRDIALS